MSAENETFAVQLARLEERMNTMRQEYKADMATLNASFADMRVESERREKRTIALMVGLLIAAITVIGAITNA